MSARTRVIAAVAAASTALGGLGGLPLGSAPAGAATTPVATAAELIRVTATPPTVNVSAQEVTIPTTVGVQYRIDGVLRAAGTHRVTTQTRITAEPLAGHALTQGSARTWDHDLRRLVTPARVTAKFTAPMSYTIPTSEGVEYQVDGAVVVPGTHPVTPPLSLKVSAQPKTGYRFASTPTWTYDFTASATVVTAPAPTGSAPNSTLSIPQAEGVRYLIGGVTVAAGVHEQRGMVTVTAVSSDPTRYTLSGTTSWTLDLRKPVTPTSPRSNTAAATYMIPATEGVTYQVNGVPRAAGTYPGTGTVVVAAVPFDDTYVVIGTRDWTFTFAASGVITPPAPTANAAAGQLTIPERAGVRYLVNGAVRAAGTYPYTGWVQVTAEATNGGVTLAGTTSWSLDLRAPLVPLPPVWNTSAWTVQLPTITGLEYRIGERAVTGTVPATPETRVVVRVINTATTVIKAGAISEWASPLARFIVTAPAPTANRTTQRITIPSVMGVQYLINGVVVPAGVRGGSGKVAVSAQVTSDRYQLSGTRSWTLDVTKPPLVRVSATKPAFTRATGTIKVPRRAGVTYWSSGVNVTGKKLVIKKKGNSRTVTARAVSGYQLIGTVKWTFKR